MADDAAAVEAVVVDDDDGGVGGGRAGEGVLLGIARPDKVAAEGGAEPSREAGEGATEAVVVDDDDCDAPLNPAFIRAMRVNNCR